MHITNGGNENPDDRAMMLSEGKRGGLSSRPRNDKRTGAGNDENFRAPSWIKAADGRTYPEGLPVRSRSQSGTLLCAAMVLAGNYSETEKVIFTKLGFPPGCP